MVLWRLKGDGGRGSVQSRKKEKVHEYASQQDGEAKGDVKKNRGLITRWNGLRFLHSLLCQTTLLTNTSTMESIWGFADGTV